MVVQGKRRKNVFSSTISYALALGIYKGYSKIITYGIELGTETEFFHQRENFTFWAGVAVGRGIEVECYTDFLMNAPLYGYEGEVTLAYDIFWQRREELKVPTQNALEEYNKAKAATLDIAEKLRNDTAHMNDFVMASREQVTRAVEFGLHDGAEFDFIPQSTVVSFRYVFASEEYHEYVNQFNDAFGFFISGPGITGPFSNNSKNLALITLTTIPVTINTVNCGNPYNCATSCENCQFFVNNNQQFTQYDAFTNVLTAWANVIPCETDHIKLAIGDGVDHVYDSGVFLEANSFSSVGIQNEVVYTIDVPSDGTEVYIIAHSVTCGYY